MGLRQDIGAMGAHGPGSPRNFVLKNGKVFGL